MATPNLFHKREPLIRELYGLGLSVDSIAVLLVEWSRSTISNDITRMGGIQAFQDRPTAGQKDVIFKRCITRFFEAYANRHRANHEHDMADTLGQFLKMESIISAVQAVMEAHDLYKRPTVSVEFEPYAHLVCAMFGEQLFRFTAHDSRTPTPRNAMNFLEKHASHPPDDVTSVEQYRRYAIMSLSEKLSVGEHIADHSEIEIKEAIERAFVTLYPHEESILRMRFGLQKETPYIMTLEDVATDRFVSRERIRQIQKKALRKIRTRTHGLTKEMRTVNELLEALAATQDELNFERSRREIAEQKLVDHTNAKQEARAVINDIAHPHLCKPIEDLELSVRAYNCLRFSNMHFLGDVCTTTEAKLLQIKNLGRKTFKEIKAIVAEHGLTLGMKIPTWELMRPEVSKHPHTW